MNPAPPVFVPSACTEVGGGRGKGDVKMLYTRNRRVPEGTCAFGTSVPLLKERNRNTGGAG